MICKVISDKEEKEYVDKYIVKIINCEFKELKDLKIIIYINKDLELEYGDIIRINGNLENPEKARNKNGFDYSRYLRQEKIYGICKVENLEKINKKTDIFFYIFKLKSISGCVIEKNFNEEEAGFLKGLLLGDMDFISTESKKEFQKSNLAHVLAISGMHFTYIIIVIDFIFEKLVIPKKIKYYLEILFIIFFIIFTGASVSCIRSGIMMILVIISKIIYRHRDFYSNLFFSFIFILLLNPYNLESVGMWLSFLGTLSLVVFNRKIDNDNKIINYILNNLYMSFVVQLFIFPITIYFFNTISLTFFISNLLISIFSGPVLIIGYLCLFFCDFKILIILEKFIVKIISNVARNVADIEFSSILVSSISIYVVVLYYICIFVFVNRKFLKESQSIKYLLKKCKKIVFNNKLILIIIVLLLLVILLVFYLFSFFRKEIQINFIDVGQGECTLIILPNNKKILIDGGDKLDNFDYGERVVVPYLLDKNITKIDYMIVSHFDSDHVGGLLYVAQNLEIDNILIGVQFEENQNLYELLKIINNKKINLKILEKGDKFNFDHNIFIEVLFPIKNKKIKENAINNNSLVFKLYLNNISILFTGDIEKEAEEEIVKLYGKKLESDILKVAHHGSNTSSIEKFIECVNPKIALIGVRKE